MEAFGPEVSCRFRNLLILDVPVEVQEDNRRRDSASRSGEELYVSSRDGSGCSLRSAMLNP